MAMQKTWAGPINGNENAMFGGGWRRRTAAAASAALLVAAARRRDAAVATALAQVTWRRRRRQAISEGWLNNRLKYHCGCIIPLWPVAISG